MVYHAPVDLLRHAVVITTVSCFHVINGNAHASRDDGGEAAVGIPQDEQLIRSMLAEGLFTAFQYLCDLRGKSLAAHAHHHIWSAHAKLLKKNIAQTFFEVLPGVNEGVLEGFIKLRNDEAEADDL